MPRFLIVPLLFLVATPLYAQGRRDGTWWNLQPNASITITFALGILDDLSCKSLAQERCFERRFSAKVYLQSNQLFCFLGILQ